MIQETKKILEDENLKMAATCVRVPVVSGHSESVYIELEKATVTEIKEVLMDAPVLFCRITLVNSCIQCHYMQKGK